MEYFAGLDISMKETHICVMDRDGKVALEAKAATLPAAIATEFFFLRHQCKSSERSTLRVPRSQV